MAIKQTETLDAVFAALSDPTRRAILERLAKGEATVLELAKPFAMSQPAISKHLKVLERAGLIRRDRIGSSRPCRLVSEPLARADSYLAHYRRFREESFAELDEVLMEMMAEENPPNPPGKEKTARRRKHE